MIDIPIKQRGRALIDFEVGVRLAAQRRQQACEGVLAKRGVTAETLPDDMDARHALIDKTLCDVRPWTTRAWLGDWSAREHGRVCEEALDEVVDIAATALDKLEQGASTLTDEGAAKPRYWSEVWFHRTRGGWDASRYNGYVHGELVHRRYVSRIYPGDIYAQRRRVLEALGEFTARDIVEFGTSSGHYTVALAERFPEAQIIGIDPSRRMLEQARRVGNGLGHGWDLRVGVGEDSGLPDESMDLVTSYAVHHELPPRIINRWFAEAWRMLRPGGMLLMADVPRYADLDRLAAWRFDWAAKWGGEPFWRASAQMDLGESARAAGFVDVTATGLPPMGNPHFVVGRKHG
ncbi:class I SAM-dependent methyltransferase [Sphingobium sp.]|uniref:class I SAM-dependent methyltransferase n=1 Tax=Sphingobium sp. TaxID=1912891 RepID=UPI002BDF7DFC|nr:class I SAM-dependent methyltransferase [Sphingobium sp.]HUD95514.1 class I SAM-dependent methyltransferase [Sphingobium sp.]